VLLKKAEKMIKKKIINFFTERNLILVIIFLSVVARLFYLKVPFIINVADGAGYVSMADLALEGNWQSFLDDFTYRTPLYPLFIAFTKILFGKAFVIGLPLIQHVLGIIEAVLIFQIGKKVFNKWIGFAAGVLTGISAYPIYWEHNSMSDFFFSFMTVLTMYLFLRALSENMTRDYLWVGVIYGFNLLTRPLLQYFFITFPFLIFLFRKNIKETLRKFLLIMIPALLIISPWFYQNLTRHRYFGFTPFLGVQLIVRGQKFIDFNSPLRAKEKAVYKQTMVDSGHNGQVAVAGWANLQTKLKYTPTQANQALQEIAMEAIKNNFSQYLKETVDQAVVLISNNSAEYFFADIDLDPKFRQQYYQKIINNDYWTIQHQKWTLKLTIKMAIFFIFAVFGMLMAVFKKNFKSFLFALVTIYMLLVMAAIEEGTVTRYRIPLDPYIFIFTAYAVNIVIDLAKSINNKYDECLVKE